MRLINSPDYRLLVSVGGGEYVGVVRGCVVFKDPKDGYEMKLFTSWCKGPADVAMAIKAHREFVRDFPAWEPVEK
jgi:hypothetical protein